MNAYFYGVLTDSTDPNVMTAFVADYRIGGQDVLLYEQPYRDAWFSTTAQKIQVGNWQGQIFQDDSGNYALQWYQDAMLCQITSKLPPARLAQLASFFQPIKGWELLR